MVALVEFYANGNCIIDDDNGDNTDDCSELCTTLITTVSDVCPDVSNNRKCIRQ